jgi:hypothetical protein
VSHCVSCAPNMSCLRTKKRGSAGRSEAIKKPLLRLRHEALVPRLIESTKGLMPLKFLGNGPGDDVVVLSIAVGGSPEASAAASTPAASASPSSRAASSAALSTSPRTAAFASCAWTSAYFSGKSFFSSSHAATLPCLQKETRVVSPGTAGPCVVTRRSRRGSMRLMLDSRR